MQFAQAPQQWSTADLLASAIIQLHKSTHVLPPPTKEEIYQWATHMHNKNDRSLIRKVLDVQIESDIFQTGQGATVKRARMGGL